MFFAALTAIRVKVTTLKTQVLRNILGEFSFSVGRSGVVRILGLLANYFFFALMGNMYGAAALGRFAVARIVLMIASTISVHGLMTALVRFTGQDLADNGLMMARARLIWSAKRVAAVSVALSSILVVSAGPIATYLFSDPGLADPLRIMCAIILPFSLVQLTSGFSQGVGNAGMSMALRFLFVPAWALLVLVVVPAQQWGDATSVLAYALGVLISFATALFVVSRGPRAIRLTRGNRDEMLRVAFPLFWSGAAGTLLGWADTLMLQLFGDSGEVGLYAVAFRLALFTNVTRQIVNSVAAGRLARAFKAGDVNAQQDILSRSVHLGVAGATPFVLLICICSPSLLSMIGSEFVAATLLVQIIVLGEFAAMCLGSAGMAMQMTGLERSFQRIVVGTLVLNIVLNFFLIPVYGAIGAAIATAASGLVQRGLMAFIVYKSHKLVTLVFFSGHGRRSG